MNRTAADEVPQPFYFGGYLEVEGDAQNYFTYGLQCLGGWQGTWVQLDVIEDVSPRREDVLCLATKFNMLNLSPIHFRDAVLDSVNG